MKVLTVFVEGLDSGGIENYLLRFLKYSHWRFSQVNIICKSGRIGALEKEFKEIPNVVITSSKTGYFNIFQFRRLNNILKGHQANCMIDFTGHFAAVPIFLAYKNRVEKRIAFYRSSTDRFTSNFIKRIYVAFAKKVILKYATSILANSEEAFKNFYKDLYLKDNRFEVLPNGINPEEFDNIDLDLRTELHISRDRFVVGHIGRLNEAKNHTTIIKTAIELCALDKSIAFIACGKNVETLAEKIPYEYKANIFLLPYRRDIKNVLAAFDLFYFPSLTEGNPNALLEAMLFKIPIVTSNIEAIRVCMPPDKYEDLVAPKDYQSATDIIIDYKTGKKNVFNYREWVIKNYYYKTLFNKLLVYL